MHPVFIFNCEESKLFKQGKTFHSELLKYFAKRQIVWCHLNLFYWPKQPKYVTKQEY